MSTESPLTRFGSLSDFTKGSVEIIDDDPRRYAFSNVFEVASRSRPYERVAVGKNLDYVIEAVRVEGDSGWWTCAHDESALVLDGELEVMFLKPEQSAALQSSDSGAVSIPTKPEGRAMGSVLAKRGHLVLLPRACAYSFSARQTGVVLIQTKLGPETVERWSEICQGGV